MSKSDNSNKKQIKEGIDLIKVDPKPVQTSPDKVTVAEVNAEMSKEYGWLGNDIVGAMKCILRESVKIRMMLEKGVK